MSVVLNRGLYFLILGIFSAGFTFILARYFQHLSFFMYVAVSATLFLVLSALFESLTKWISHKIHKAFILSGFNRKIYRFYDKIRVSFSINDFVNVIRECLEDQADFSALWLDTRKKTPIYCTVGKFPPDCALMKKLPEFASVGEGLHYLGESLNLVSKPRFAKGLLFSFGGYQLFVFSQYLSVFEPHLFLDISREFSAYLNRVETIEKMFSLSAISKEWELLAQTQQSFLPQQIPYTPGLTVEAYYKPLVNVSGDYYDVVPAGEHKSLLALGDVSGKGLSAALIMGIIVNTIKIVEDKEDLTGIILAIDSAIKAMAFQGKYTTVFLGLFDNATRTLKYINAGMPDLMLIREDSVVSMKSNAPIVGIIQLPKLTPIEIAITEDDYLLIVSDGVTEAENEDGIQLEETPEFETTLKDIKDGSAKQIAASIVQMIETHTGSARVRDDVTFLVAKAGGDR